MTEAHPPRASALDRDTAVMTTDLEVDAGRAAAMCREAHGRLMVSVAKLTDTDMCRPSRLPAWSVGHVLTHLARNADAHARRLSGALDGRDVPKYVGGAEQRSAEIDAGAQRPARLIIDDLADSQRTLERLFSECAAAGWPNPDVGPAGGYGARACPAHRLREVEMHHVDLGLSYTPSDWPAAYVHWDLGILLGTVRERLRGPDARAKFMAWLAGRGDLPTDVSLEPWG